MTLDVCSLRKTQQLIGAESLPQKVLRVRAGLSRPREQEGCTAILPKKHGLICHCFFRDE
jgi:hypothetical protein